MTSLVGFDLVVERVVDAEVIRAALAKVFALPAERISIIDDLANYPERGAADIVCVVSPVIGEFAALLSIQSEPLQVPAETPLDVARVLAAVLGTRCLLPRDGVNPFLMWLVLPDSTASGVALDPEALAEERYVIQ
jgi:hypothetical protein